MEYASSGDILGNNDLSEKSSQRIYELGRKKAKIDAEYSKSPEYKKRVEDNERKNAAAWKKGGVVREYDLGRQLSSAQRGQIALIDEYCRNHGVVCVVVDGMTDDKLGDNYVVNGTYAGKNVIFISLDGKELLTATAGHELFHFIKKYSSKEAEKLQRFIVDTLKNDDSVGFESLYNEYAERYSNVYEKNENFENNVLEEIAADSCFQVLSNEHTWSEYLNGNLSTGKKIVNWMRSLVKELTEWINKKFGNSMGQIRKSLSSDVEKLNKIADMYEKAIRKATENYQSKSGTGTEGETRFSINEIVDDDGNEYGIGVVLDSNLLEGLAKNERKQMVKERVVGELAGRQIIAYDKNGNAVGISFAEKGDKFKNKNGKNASVLKELYHKNIDKSIKQEAVVLADELIESAEYRESERAKYSHDWLDNNGKNKWDYWDVYIQDKNKTVYVATLNVANTQNGNKILYDIDPIKKARGPVKSGPTIANTNVSQNDTDVNTHYMQESKKYSVSDSEGNELSESQQEYFADSKVRDEKGNLLVVRHGTDADFNIFDFSKAGKNGAAEGYGFYFSDDPEITERYGKNQREVYLNITKPLYNNKITVRKSEITKFVNAMIDFDVNKYSDEGLTWQDSFLSNYVDTYSVPRNSAVREFIDQLFSGNDNDSDLVYEIATVDGRTYDPTLIKEFYNVLTDSTGYDGMIAEWKHKDGTSNVYVTFDSNQAKNITNTSPTQNPDLRYSISKRFYEDFDKWDGKDTNTAFEIGNTSKALQSIGIKDQLFIMRSGMIIQKLNKHPELTRSIFRSIPELLEHPVIVQFSDDINPKTGKQKFDSRITLLGELYAEMTVDGEKQRTPVLVSVELLPKTKGKTEISDFSVITSAYAKNNLQRYLNENSILYIDPNKKRTNNWLSLNRLQLPLGENRLGSIRRITYADGKVKIENAKNFTAMQAALEKAGVVDSSGISILENVSNDTRMMENLKKSISLAGLDETTQSEIARMEKENSELKRLNSELKEQFKITKGVKLNEKSIRALARKIKKEYSSNIDSQMLAGMLSSLYNWAANDKLSPEHLRQQSVDIAKAIISESWEPIDSQELSDMRAVLSSGNIKLSDADKVDIKYTYNMNAGEFYRKYGKKLGVRSENSKGAVYIDQVWDELCDALPGMLDENAISTQEMWHSLIRVSDLLDQGRGFNPYLAAADGVTAEQEAHVLAYRIEDEFFDIPEVKTFADKQLEQRNKLESKLQEKYKEALDRLEQRYSRKLTAEQEKVAMLRERFHANVAGRNKTQTKNKLKRLVKKMNSLLVNGTKERNVKIGMRETALAAISAANELFEKRNDFEILYSVPLSGKTGEQRTALSNFQRLYTEYLNSVELMEKANRAGLAESVEKYRKNIESQKKMLQKMVEQPGLSELLKSERAEINKGTVGKALQKLVDTYRKRDVAKVAEIKRKLSYTGLYDNLDQVLKSWRDAGQND